MEELGRLDSSRLYGNHHPGCIWSLFHVFNFYQRRETKKILSFQRLSDSNYNLGSISLIANDEAGGKEIVADKGANLQEEVKPNNTNKLSGKARIINFIGKKLLKRQKHKGKMSHSSSQLKRMISIHHLECNDFGAPGEFDEKTSDSETSARTLSLDGTDPAAISEHESPVINGLPGSFDRKQGAYWALDAFDDISHKSQRFDKIGNHLLDEHKILKDKLIEARDALLMQKDTDPRGMTREFSFRSKIFLDTLHLFNNHREALYKLCKDQNSLLTNDIQISEYPAEARVLNKSLSIAGFELSGNATRIAISRHKQIGSYSFVNQGPKSESSLVTVGIASDIENSPGFDELRKQRETGTVLSHFRNLKHRINDVFEENKKGSQRISRDGILHKVPFGHKLLEDKEDEKLHLRDGPISEKYFRGTQGFKCDSVARDSSNIRFTSFQRSRSLSDSLERYCQLMDSISANEWRKAPVRSNSVREGSGLQQGKRPNIHGRMLSSPELRSYSFSKDVQGEINLAFQAPKKPMSEPIDCDMVATADDSDKLNSDIVMQPVVEDNSGEEEGAFKYNIVKADKAIVPDKLVIPTLETSITETQGHEGQLSSVKECLQVETFHFTEVEEKYDLFNEHVTPTIDETNNKPEKPSPITVLDASIVEEPVTPVNFIASEGSELQLSCIDFNEEHPLSEALNDIDSVGHKVVELPNLGFDEGATTRDGFGAISFLAHQNHKNAARFNYLKHILSKSGYDVLLRKTDDLFYEVDAASQMLPDIPFEEQHLCDLLNELLLKICEYSTAPSSWLQRFHSKIRLMPTGNLLLEEVWTEIRWLLLSQLQLGTTLDHLITRDFTKNDGWMNLYRDAECFGLLIEQLMLDDLIEEIILDCDGL